MNQKPLFLTVALIALLVIAGAFWCIQNRPPMAVNQPVVTEPVVEAPVQVEPQAEPGVNPDTYPQHIEAIPENTDEVWYNIPELSIRMRLNKEFAEDLVYIYRHERDDNGEEWDVADLSLKKLEHVVPGCGGYGILTKNKGNLKEMEKGKDVLSPYISSRLGEFAQAGEYYYGWTGRQEVCWDPSLEPEVRKVFPGKYNGTGAKYVADGLKTIELIPQN